LEKLEEKLLIFENENLLKIKEFCRKKCGYKKMNHEQNIFCVLVNVKS